jgi:hypothetical protein
MIATSYVLLLTAYDGSVASIAFKERRLSSRHVQNRRLPKPSILGMPTAERAAFQIFYAKVCDAR